MKANPDKFQALAVGEKTFALKPVNKIGEAEIECEVSVKLFGVEIDFLTSNLTFTSLPCAGRHLNRLIF